MMKDKLARIFLSVGLLIMLGSATWAQTGVKADSQRSAKRVTVTLVRWPYT
jgi:hypothetical protein